MYLIVSIQKLATYPIDLECHCLLSPDGEDPIFIGINRLVAKGLKQDENKDNSIQYPCHVANRFECPYNYEKGKRSDTKFDVDDLYDMAFAVKIALAGSQFYSITLIN